VKKPGPRLGAVGRCCQRRRPTESTRSQLPSPSTVGWVFVVEVCVGASS
jgi:hypothetical protein